MTPHSAFDSSSSQSFPSHFCLSPSLSFIFWAGSSPPGAGVAVELDVAWKEKEVDAAIQLAWDAFSGLDIVVNNAGLRGTRLPSTDSRIMLKYYFL